MAKCCLSPWWDRVACGMLCGLYCNQFFVPRENAASFKQKWVERDSKLKECNGFVAFTTVCYIEMDRQKGMALAWWLMMSPPISAPPSGVIAKHLMLVTRVNPSRLPMVRAGDWPPGQEQRMTSNNPEENLWSGANPQDLYSMTALWPSLLKMAHEHIHFPCKKNWWYTSDLLLHLAQTVFPSNQFSSCHWYYSGLASYWKQTLAPGARRPE